ncbi:MAG: TVP38/TMEM64 family protein, partial [Sulfobacillus sp.]
MSYLSTNRRYPWSKSKKRLGILMGIVVLSSVVALALEPGWRSGVAHLLSLETLAHVRVLVESMGMWGPIFLMALMVLHSVTFVPSEILTIAAVALFGPVKGVIYSWVGSMLGAYLAFFMARGFGRPLVGRFVPSSAL